MTLTDATADKRVRPGDLVETAAAALRMVNETLDVHDLGPDELLELSSLYATCSKLAAAGSMLCTAQIDATGAYRRKGHRNAADNLAADAGVSAGAAHDRLQTAKKLRQRRATEDAMRKGAISPEQASITADAHEDDENTLLDLAQRRGMKGLRDEAERLAAARRTEEAAMDAYRRVHQERDIRTWTRHGAFCFAGSMTLDDGARFMSELEARRAEIFRQAQRDGRHEPNGAYLLDALVDIVTGNPAAPNRARAGLVIRADADAIKRGHLEPGETCEVTGFGPIPVTIARSLLADSEQHTVVFNGLDVHDISHVTRTISPAIRRALEALYPTCVVPGCDQTKGLEIDHIVPFAQGGKTELANLDRKCRGHHRLKTLYGWQLTGPPHNRQWLPPPTDNGPPPHHRE